jgi:cell cycle related kinase
VLGHLGSPTAESWPDLTSLPDYNKITFPYNKGILWERIVPDAQQEAVDLIKSILIYDSSKRLTAEEVYASLLYLKILPAIRLINYKLFYFY